QPIIFSGIFTPVFSIIPLLYIQRKQLFRVRMALFRKEFSCFKIIHYHTIFQNDKALNNLIKHSKIMRDNNHRSLMQIGRASCRERRKISVDAAAVKEV